MIKIKLSEYLEPDFSKRFLLIVFALIGLMLVFIFQRFDYSQLIPQALMSTKYKFIVNRSIRFLLNDNLMLILIYSLFYKVKYVKLGLYVELFGFVFLLIPYFILRFNTDIDHMQLSFLHRLIVNPTLMILLLPALYIQEKKQNA